MLRTGKFILLSFIFCLSALISPITTALNQYPNMKFYLKHVYPYERSPKLSELFFFYYSVPKSVFPNPPHSWSVITGGYKFNALYVPFYVKQGFFINKYPKNDWNNYQYKNGFKNNSWVEVLHACCDNPNTGYWLYFAKGSGIEWNIGKTLVAKNKIEALHKLGISFENMAQLFPHFKFRSANGSWMSWQQMAKLKHVTNYSQLLKQAAKGTEFAITRMSNSVDMDKMLAQLAHKKGYDSVQMTIQPNGNGGWAFEIIGVRKLNFIPPNKQICPKKNTLRLPGNKPCVCSNKSNAIALYCKGQESEQMYIRNKTNRSKAQ